MPLRSGLCGIHGCVWGISHNQVLLCLPKHCSGRAVYQRLDCATDLPARIEEGRAKRLKRIYIEGAARAPATAIYAEVSRPQTTTYCGYLSEVDNQLAK